MSETQTRGGWWSSLWGYLIALIVAAVLAWFYLSSDQPGETASVPATEVLAGPASQEQSGAEMIADPSGLSNALGDKSDSEFWRKIRDGDQFDASANAPGAGMMIQSGGQVWRQFRMDVLPKYGGRALMGMIALLALFFLLRGRIAIARGWAGKTIRRFNWIERTGHWLLAISFIILALTGLNLLYGRDLLIPLIGKDAFASITVLGKYAHNYVAFPFIVGLVWVFLQWVWDNIPGWTDIRWFMAGGGIIGGGHPDSKRFNGGQKLIFWTVILGGASLTASGWALLFPFETHFFAHTASLVNPVVSAINGITGAALPVLPVDPTPIMEQQLNQSWHGIVAIVLIAIIIAHIYIGSVGMQGAFDAIGTGDVDENWAREHHNLWVADMEARGRVPDTANIPDEPAPPQPAE